VASIYDCIGLPNKKFSVLFFGIQGCDDRERTSPSWFNRIEVTRVVYLITTLRGAGVTEADIGVITPYRGQVFKIYKALKMPQVLVGTAEQFLAQERENFTSLS
jgi:helicase MOV-10